MRTVRRRAVGVHLRLAGGRVGPGRCEARPAVPGGSAIIVPLAAGRSKSREEVRRPRSLLSTSCASYKNDVLGPVFPWRASTLVGGGGCSRSRMRKGGR